MIRTFITIGLIMVLLSSCKKNDESFVISKLQNASKLATTETVIDKVIVGYKEKRLVGLVKIGTAEFVANSKAYIKTGIDLNDLKPEDVKIEGKSISIDLPQIKV